MLSAATISFLCAVSVKVLPTRLCCCLCCRLENAIKQKFPGADITFSFEATPHATGRFEPSQHYVRIFLCTSAMSRLAETKGLDDSDKHEEPSVYGTRPALHLSGDVEQSGGHCGEPRRATVRPTGSTTSRLHRAPSYGLGLARLDASSLPVLPPGFFEVEVNGELVHSKQNGMGHVDSAEKMQAILDKVGAALAK